MTFDHFAELRARLAVAAILEHEGVPRTQMVNSIGFDAWTQLEQTGYLNDKRIVRPAGAYREDPLAKEKEAVYWFLPQLPAIEPRYVVTNVASGAEPIRKTDRLFAYRTILPPRDRVLVIRRVPWPPVVSDNAPTTANVRIVR